MIRRIAPLAIAITALLTPSLAAAQWTAPTQSPPDGNAAAPINTSSTAQTKSGSLVVGSLGSSGGGYFLGNFGIGTTGPSYTLDVRGSSATLNVQSSASSQNAKVRVAVPATATADPIFNLWAGSVEEWQMGIDSSDSGKLKFQAGGAALGTSAALTLTSSSGRLGIGTTSPSHKLTVAGDINFTGNIYQNGSAFSSGGQWTTSGNDIYSSNSGNVGIGTTTPSEKLSVAGNGYFTGNILLGTEDAYLGRSDYSSIKWNDIGSGDASINAKHNVVVNIDSNNNDSTSGFYVNQHQTGYATTNSLFTVRDSGNVGIGATSPTAKLSFGGYYINTATPTADEQTSHIRLYDTGNGSVNYGIGVSSNALNIAANQSSGTIRLYTNSSERLRVDASGNVGIGNSTPTQKLEVQGNVDVTSDGTSGLGFTPASGSRGGSIVTVSGSDRNVAMTFGSTGNVGIGSTTPGSKFTVAGGAIGGTYGLTPAYATWGAYGTGDGGSGIYNDNGTYKKLMIVGNSSANGSNRVVGIWDDLVVAANTYSTGFYYSSDKALKENIEKLDGKESLDKVTSLEGVSFDWKKDGKKSVGLIAQEVEKVYPELVSTNGEGLKSVEYGNLVAPLIEAVKEQQRQIDALKAEVESLKAGK